ncbi:ATPase component of various ABC-type transport systems with duplicated ATPase domain [Desulfitobacterium dichloroeliminans LMG P-21439]|uniref:ATPase component of various ABC-type transport systems with duplicated ATPase domain n=1 Tax=Desulfitobacterium dichloroeliminans (strain LMG P-21439 / DCA1) TaxID=871963 RepID=L0F5U5_DESDL|nr:ATPase component of various ABC-type transport systems with duplicated ATPase domain [Desulfitobacterium dichloroeliminans LMG P-21439]
MKKTLRGKNICYGVLDRIDFSLQQGEVVALMGPNGSGKTTLARILAGFIEPKEGELRLLQDGVIKPWTEVKRWQEIGIIGQHPRRQIIGATVAEELGFGLLNLGYEVKRVQKMVKEIAREMGLGAQLNQSPSTLSGGERQRLVLASILAIKPSFLILDEALSMLDERAQEACLAQLKEKGEGMAQLWITHDPELAAKADRLWVMREGKLLDVGLPQAALQDRDFCQSLSLRSLHRPILLENRNLGSSNSESSNSGEGLGDKYFRIQSLRHSGETDSKPPLSQGNPLEWQEANYPSRLFLTETIKDKSFLAILGPSGSGKSTLLESAIALIKPTEGKFCAFGQDVTFENRELRRRARLILQEPGEYFLGSTVEDEVFYLQSKKERKSKADLNLAYLEVFGVPRKLATAYPERLSGGERQRVALAAALESLPEVLLLDEPLLGLDAEGWSMFRGLLRELKGKLTIVYVTHDLSEVRDLADKVWLIEEGKVSFNCPAKDIDGQVGRLKEAGVRC